MRITLTLLALASCISPVLAQEKSPLSGNLTLSSEYLFRGISQTAHRPALQGGLEYAAPAGWYGGLWASNISWLGDSAAGVSASLELDLYGGWRGTAGDFSYDLGLLRYQYPGSYPAGYTLPHTTEWYAQGSWKMLSLKYSQSLGNTFGVADSARSGYLEGNLAYELNPAFTLNLHAGHQRYQGNGNAVFSYSDWRIEGVWNAPQSWQLGAGYSDTNASRTAYTNPQGRYLGAGRLYVFGKKNW